MGFANRNRLTAKAEKGSASDKGIPLRRIGGGPLELPKISTLVRYQLNSTFVGFVLNSVLALLAGSVFAFPSIGDWLWEIIQPNLCEDNCQQLRGTIAFAAIVAIATPFCIVTPLHSFHDRAIKFLVGIEICKRISNEIVNTDYASEQPPKKFWAVGIDREYKHVRQFGKGSLRFLWPTIVVGLLSPWVLMLWYLNWNSVLVSIVVLFFAPIVVVATWELFREILSNKGDFILGGLDDG